MSSDVPDATLMSYGTDKKPSYLQAEIQVCQENYQDLSEKVQEQQDVIRELESDFKKATDDLLLAKNALEELSKEKSTLMKSQSSLLKKLHKTDKAYEATLNDLLCVEDELQEEKIKLSD